MDIAVHGDVHGDERGALFTVSGRTLVTIAVEGRLDGIAVRGLRSLIAGLSPGPDVTIDLTRCSAWEDEALVALTSAARRTEAAGRHISVLACPTVASRP